MTDYRAMFDRTYLGSWDLPKDRDAIVTIEKVEVGELSNGKKKSRKPVVHFHGKKLPMVVNKTNGKCIASMYGTDADAWIGKPIALYVAKVEAPMQGGGKEIVDAIRVRPTPPKAPEREGKVAQ